MMRMCLCEWREASKPRHSKYNGFSFLGLDIWSLSKIVDVLLNFGKNGEQVFFVEGAINGLMREGNETLEGFTFEKGREFFVDPINLFKQVGFGGGRKVFHHRSYAFL